VGSVVHRVVEERAAGQPDAIAILDGTRPTTYRELNQRANTLARRLCECGLTRGSLALVRLPRSTDLAVVLLAVLKAGAYYAWMEPGSKDDVELPTRFCVLRGRSNGEEQYLALDIERALRETALRPGPNLPVLTRGSDVACVLGDFGDQPLLVPHATIASLPATTAKRSDWEGSPGALDLWVGLMSGATLSVGVGSPATAAA
jgi:hypothetical protein